MKIKVLTLVRRFLPGILLIFACVAVMLSMVHPGARRGSDNEAGHVGEVVNRRMAILDGYMNEALKGNPQEWMDLKGIPEDMVVYRYFEGKLQSWNNQLPIQNDDISAKMVFHSLTNPFMSLSSPLADVTEKVQLMNFGPDWYLVHSRDSLSCRVIGALMIMGGERGPGSRINPAFGLDHRFAVDQLSVDEGSPVYYGDMPVFKLIGNFAPTNRVNYPGLIWVAFMLVMCAFLVLIAQKRNWGRAFLCFSLMTVLMMALYLWGRKIRMGLPLFAPHIYADGPVLYSLGAVLIINAWIFFAVATLFIMRRRLYSLILSSNKRKLASALASAGFVLASILLLVYVHLLTRSIIQNSNISLELYRMHDLSPFTAIVYCSLLSVLMALPMLLHLGAQSLKEFTGVRVNIFSIAGRSLLALFIAIYIVSISAVLGLRTEQDRLAILANRLAMDRNLFAELQLRSIEQQIGEDVIISSLSVLPNSGNIILNRLVDNEMASISQNFDISVLVIPEDERSPELFRLVQERLNGGTPIHENSNFLYTSKSPGHPQYSGLFTYYDETYGVSHLLITLEPKSNREDRGYSGMMGMSYPGQVNLPSHYSYARYSGPVLIMSRGRFTYPTRLANDMYKLLYDNNLTHFNMDRSRHFVNHISDNEVIVISQDAVSISYYAVAIAFIALIAFVMVSLPSTSRVRKGKTKGYFQNRITSVLMVSLTLTLVSMAAVSVYFVYSRNTANRNALMEDKIKSIRAIVENNVRNVSDARELYSPEFRDFLDVASEMAGLDITVYSTDGRVFMSTTPEIFDRRYRYTRVDQDAYDKLIYHHNGFYIQFVDMGRRSYHAMYAPVMNRDDEMIAIISSPYVDENLDFETEAVIHMVSIVVLFVVLLLLARLMINAISNRIFMPLNEMGRKMNTADIDSIETINYNRKDEISTLVDAYNRMVSELQESSRKLANAERDKAWTGMARQVAHEIKNPLTPMKLQMQRLVRLKHKNSPGWEEKFDEVANTVLEHIDILSDTANEFSTFAKLYAEEPTEIELDTLLQDEISMFDNKENISFSYFGLSGARVMGPKPQLTRVFVNLITNSIQAIENMPVEGTEARGRIIVSLRNSVTDGYYDIVFEDDGPGVASENLGKLFTPNFTTKSGGAGIGLAICRSILDRCGAEISYSKSFALGGACFTIKYPK